MYLPSHSVVEEHAPSWKIASISLPANLLTRRAAILMRSYISGIMENWLFAPQSFDLKREARDYVAILLEMYQFCPTLRADPGAQPA
jgi:TetR/AcrR family acrAB operon transcriptional repressor